MGDPPNSSHTEHLVSFSRKVERDRSPSLSRLYRRPSLVRSPIRTLGSPRLTDTEIDDLTNPLLPYSTTYTYAASTAYRSGATDQYVIPNMTFHELEFPGNVDRIQLRKIRLSVFQRIVDFLYWILYTFFSWIRAGYATVIYGIDMLVTLIRYLFRQLKSAFFHSYSLVTNTFKYILVNPLVWIHQTITSFSAPIPTSFEVDEEHRRLQTSEPNKTPDHPSDYLHRRYSLRIRPDHGNRTTSSRSSVRGIIMDASFFDEDDIQICHIGRTDYERASTDESISRIGNTAKRPPRRTTSAHRPPPVKQIKNVTDKTKSGSLNTETNENRGAFAYFANVFGCAVEWITFIVFSPFIYLPLGLLYVYNSFVSFVSLIYTRFLKKPVMGTAIDSEDRASPVYAAVPLPLSRAVGAMMGWIISKVYRLLQLTASVLFFLINLPIYGYYKIYSIAEDVRFGRRSSYWCSWWMLIPLFLLAMLLLSGRGSEVIDKAKMVVPVGEDAYQGIYDLSQKATKYAYKLGEASSSKLNAFVDEVHENAEDIYNYGFWSRFNHAAMSVYYGIGEVLITIGNFIATLWSNFTDCVASTTRFSWDVLRSLGNFVTYLWSNFTSTVSNTAHYCWELLKTIGNIFALILFNIASFVMDTLASARNLSIWKWDTPPELNYVNPHYGKETKIEEPVAPSAPHPVSPCPTCCNQAPLPPVIVQAPSTAEIEAKIRDDISSGLDDRVQKLVNLRLGKLESQVKEHHAEFAAGSASLEDKYKAKIDALHETINKLKIQLTAEMKSSGASVDMAYLESMIRSAIKTYDADKTGLPDYALESAGGSVLSTRCSETHGLSTRLEKIFNIPLFYTHYGPRTVIQRNAPALVPGECWAVTGGVAYLTIKLGRPIEVTSVSYEHIPASLSPEGDIRSAPKEFTIYAYEDETDVKTRVKLGDFIYDNSSDPLQFFPIKTKAPYAVQIVELQVDSNHGEVYTCLYRFRVHGNPLKAHASSKESTKPHDSHDEL